MRKVLLLLALFMVFMGCISDSPQSETNQEVLLSKTVYNPNSDSANDFYHFIYSEVKYQGYTIQREVYVAPEKSLSSFNYKTVDENQIVEARNLFESFSQDLKDEFLDCAKNAGISNIKCVDIEHCAVKCSDSSVLCKNLVETYPEFIGYLVLSLDYAISERVELTNEINSDLWVYSDLTAEQKKDLFENLNSLYDLSLRVLKGPLYTHQKTSLCSGSVSYHNYNNLFSILGTQELSTDSYQYLVVFSITGDGEDTGTDFVDLYLTDLIPFEFEKDSIELLQMGTIDNNKVEWAPVRSGTKEAVLFYKFDSDVMPTEEMWNTPEMQTRTVNMFLMFPTFFIFSLMQPVVGYYIAVSLSIAVPLVLLIILFNLLMLGYNVMVSKMQKKTFYRAMKNFVGVPNLTWKKDLVFGSVLFAVGIAASFFATHISDQSLNLFKFFDYLFLDHAALISVFCTVVGAVFVYIAIQSLVKSMMLRRSYAGVVQKEKAAAMDEVDELKDKIEVLRNRIAEYRKEGFDITEAYNTLVSIPMDRISKVDQKNIKDEATFIERSLNKVENAISLMEQRKNEAEQNWESWSAALNEELLKEQEVYLSKMNFIPYSLRAWAANRYAKEHQMEGVVFEGQLLKRKEISTTDLLEDVMKSGKILNAVVLKDDKIYLSQVTVGNKTVIEGLFVKLISYLKTFLKKQDQKEYKYVMGIGDSTVFALVQRGKLDSLVMCPKDKFKQGFEEWKKVLENLRAE